VEALVIATRPWPAPPLARKWCEFFVPRLLCAICLALALTLLLVVSAFADEIVSYHVQDGDTFLAIANRYGVDPDDLAALNGIADPDILAIGQTLLIKVASPANPFGLTVPDRWDDLVADAQVAREPAVASTEVTDPAPLPVSLLNLIATLGTNSALQIWQPTPGHSAILPAPIYSQFDGTVWSGSNCGPTALAMALAAVGVNTDQLTLRHQADAEMGSSDPANGTSWDALVYAATASGAGTKGLVGASGYRAWAIDDLKKEIGLGHPVLLLVRYRLLPDHTDSSYGGDHYIVGLGFDQQGRLVFNDPAGNVAHGNHRRLTPDELMRAWSDTWAGQVRTAMALYR
jgi:LysM repeat protein